MRMPSPGVWVVRFAVPVLLAGAPERALGRGEYGAAVEAGPELDSNPRRLPQQGADSAQSAPLLRVTASGRAQVPLGDRFRLGAQLNGGGKVFFTEAGRPADEAVAGGQLEVTSRVRRALALAAAGSYYDAFQRQSERDFRTGSAFLRLHLSHPASATSGMLQLGYLGLRYKPVPDYSFHGLVGGVALTRELSSGREDEVVNWRLGVSYAATLRDYDGPLIGVRERCDPAPGALMLCNYPKEGSRYDVGQVLRAEVSYLGNAAATLWYSAELNHSNSYGESFVRQVLGLKFTTHLPWGLFFTVKGALQFSRFRDPYLTSQVATQTFVSIDDENRSNLVLHVGRDLWARWSVGLRYNLYVNESVSSGSPAAAATTRLPGFLRHTLFVGLRFEYESADGS
ncbi:MAG: hypothetical protein IT371_07200 [Deltaproteobacteria bacterium]|nr:hypothetical protein [Deltaproteobacteria bacterium]